MKTTTHYGIPVPERTDKTLVSDVSGAIEKLDEIIHAEATTLSNQIGDLQNAVLENGEETEANAAAIAALQEVTAVERPTVTLNSDYISGWNAVYNFKDGNTLHINGNLKLTADIPAGATLMTLPYTIGWAYGLIKQGDKLITCVATNSLVRLESNSEMLIADGSAVTIMLTASVTGAAPTETEV